jgi:DNA mismatch repair ATPase MutL
MDLAFTRHGSLLQEKLGLLLEPSRYTLPANDFTASPSTHLETDQVYDSNDASESDVLRNSADNDPQSHDPQSQDTIVMTVPAIPPNRRSRFRLNDMALDSGRMYIPANTASDGGVPTKRQYSQTTLDMVAIKCKRTVDIKETSESQQQAFSTDDEVDVQERSTDEVPLDTQEVSEDEDAFNASLERSIEVESSENMEEIIDEEDVSTAVSDSERPIKMVASEDLDFDASSYPSEQSSKIHYDGGIMQHVSDPCSPFENDDNQYILETFIPSPSVRYEEITTDHDAIVSTSRPYLGTCNLSTSIDVDATALLEQCRRRTHKEHDQARSKITSNRVPLMNANISNTTDNGEATKILDRVIDKMDFCKMRIIGQFNLGFIIAALNDHDLFIIDQHASDEKFNFETLQQTTQIKGQKLIQPRSIGLTASEEMVAMDNVEILKANGFDIEVDENAPPTQKIKIVSQPISKNTMFSTKG